MKSKIQCETKSACRRLNIATMCRDTQSRWVPLSSEYPLTEDSLRAEEDFISSEVLTWHHRPGHRAVGRLEQSRPLLHSHIYRVWEGEHEVLQGSLWPVNPAGSFKFMCGVGTCIHPCPQTGNIKKDTKNSRNKSYLDRFEKENRKTLRHFACLRPENKHKNLIFSVFQIK